MAASYKKRGLTKKEIKQEEAAKARVGAWFLFMGLIIFALVLVQNTKADEMVHKFKFPSFSGIGTSAHYLTIENQQFNRKQALKGNKSFTRRNRKRQRKHNIS